MIKILKTKLGAVLLSILTVFFLYQTASAAGLSNVTVTPESTTLGATTNHTISLRTSGTGVLGPNATIWVDYPSGFNLSNVTIGTYTGNLDGVTLTRSTNTVILTLGTTANVTGNDVVSFQLLGVVNTTNAGSYTASIETRSAAGQNVDGPTSSAAFNIGPVLDHFRVVPSTTSASVGQDVTLTITAQDASNATVTNYSGAPALSSLANSPNNTAPFYGSVSFSNGVANVIVRSYSTQANQSVTVTDSGKTGNSGVISFSPAALNSISITPSSNQTITAGQTIQFTAVSYDAYLNQRSGDALTWTSTNSSGLFNNTLAGTYTVRASLGSINSNSVSLTVNPGALNSIAISPSSNQNIKAGQTIQFTAVSYDSYGNQRSGDSFTWTATNASGLFNNTSAGSYSVKTTSGSVSSAIVTVTVSHAEAVDHLAIAPANIHLANADQTQTYTVTSYDQYGNWWDSSSQTTFSTTDPKGSFNANIYQAGKIGTWQIKASYSGKDTTTNVTIDGAGVPAKLEFSNALSQLEINTIHQFTVKVSDADDNEISNPALTWSIEQGQENAVLNQNGRFTANKTGTYKVKAKAGNVATVLTFEVIESKKTSDSQGSSSQVPSQPADSATQKSTIEASTKTAVPFKEEIPETPAEVSVAVDDSQGKIKAAEVITVGPEQQEEEGKISSWISILSVLIALAILGLAYWGYTIWTNPLAETKKTDLVKKAKTEIKEETKKIPPIESNQTDDQTRW